jgi:hypothetical protein
MKLAIMQPYFLPYIGYFQLISVVDKFVIWDNIQYTKKGWINRNRYLLNEQDAYFTLPLKKNSDTLDIRDRYLAETWQQDKKKILNKVITAYNGAPFFNEGSKLLEEVFDIEEINLFQYLLRSLQKVNSYLEITTPFIISSTISIDHSLKGEDKIIAICKELKVDQYINPRGGTELYHRKNFNEIKLSFLFTNENLSYLQFGDNFVPWLSVLDVIMFNSKNKIQEYLQEYELR